MPSIRNLSMNCKTGTLFIVATPIGNLQDMSHRAVSVLSQVSLILAEDTRHGAKLLHHYRIATKTRSYHEHNEIEKIPNIIKQLKEGHDIALISDAGTPLINDPGYKLVHTARREKIQVVPVPGPCALIAALSAAGLPTHRFCFEGFLPVKSAMRVEKLKSLILDPRTVVCYESSHRIIATLKDMHKCFPDDTQLVIARELSKKFETFYQGSVAEVLEIMESSAEHAKGEFVLAFKNDNTEETQWYEAKALLETLIEHLPARTAARIVSNTFKVSKNKLYQYALNIKD